MYLKNNAYELRESKIHYRLTIIITAKAITKTTPPAPATNKILIDLLIFQIKVQIHVHMICLRNDLLFVIHLALK